MTQLELEQELDRILQSGLITTLLQPIVDCERQIVLGYEALSRGPSASQLHSAHMLFETAERCGRSLELELMCLQKAGESWHRTGVTQQLFLNISPDSLVPALGHDVCLDTILGGIAIPPEMVVIELSERYPTTDLTGLKASLQRLKKQGFQIAIDDLGSGYSGLMLWAEVQPDYVKIDRHFIRDIQDDLVKREFVRSIYYLCASLGCKLIAEGVETEAEFKLVRELGIGNLQGFYLGRPKAIPATAFNLLSSFPQLASDHSTGTAAAMGYVVEPVSPDEQLGLALERMQQKPGLFSLPVVENGRPLGLLHKWRVMEVFSTTYGRALFEKRPVREKMSTDALVVEHDCSLSDVSRQLTSTDDHYLKQHFIITRGGLYEGLGMTRTLLKRITEKRIENARYANPLTQLPGNVPIQKELERRLASGDPFSLIYFDIDHFKPLNDVLGYARGDLVITKLGDLLAHHFGSRDNMVGHIGGDDFMVIAGFDDLRADCVRIQSRFLQETRPAYPADVQARGYVNSVDRNGAFVDFPLVSLSAGLVNVLSPGAYTSSQLSEAAAQAKRAAKARADGIHIMELVSESYSAREAQGSLQNLVATS